MEPNLIRILIRQDPFVKPVREPGVVVDTEFLVQRRRAGDLERIRFCITESILPKDRKLVSGKEDPVVAAGKCKAIESELPDIIHVFRHEERAVFCQRIITESHILYSCQGCSTDFQVGGLPSVERFHTDRLNVIRNPAKLIFEAADGSAEQERPVSGQQELMVFGNPVISVSAAIEPGKADAARK